MGWGVTAKSSTAPPGSWPHDADLRIVEIGWSTGGATMPFTPEYKQKIVDKLIEIKATRPCTRCGNNQLVVLDGFVSPQLQQEPANLYIGIPHIPCAAVACAKCGHINLHALGILGLPPVQEKAP